MPRVMPDNTIYDTDISPPALGQHLVREHLLRQFRNSPKKLTLIQAPPGYGKTALLTQIFKNEPVASAWVNLRAADNDPVNFIHKLSAAISDTAPQSQSNVNQQLGGLAPPSFVPWIRSRVAEMNRHARFHVYLNDVDFVSNPVTLELIENLIQASRASVRFFVTATQTVEFSYANLLIENQVASVNQQSLRFDTADTQAYYLMVQGTDLAEKTAQTLTDICEGWPAAISFAVNTLSNEAQIVELISELSSIQKAFDRYFIERIFERQTAEIQQLMLRLCLLDRFSIPLTQQLSDSPQHSREFAAYIQNHTFITPIDASGKWFRFHQLFNLFLKSRCEQTLTEAQRSYWQLKAADWFASEGQMEEAIQLAMQAGAAEQAATWMERAFPMVVVRLGKHVTYANWFLDLSDKAIENFPRVRIGYIWSLTARRQYMAVAEQVSWLQQHKGRYDRDIVEEIDRTSSLILCAMKGLQDDAKSGDPLVTQWLEKWSDVSSFRQQDDYHYESGLAYLLKGFSAKCLSDFKGARFALNQALSHFEAYGSYYGQAWARSLLAVTYAKQGFHHEAQMEAQEGYQIAKTHLGENSHSGYGLAALLGAIHYEHDELDLARNYLTDCLESLKEQSATDLLSAAYETSARLFMQQQSFEEGLGFLKDGIKWAEAQRLERLKNKLVDELIVWLLRLQRRFEAEQYASQYDLILKTANDFEPSRTLHRVCARSIVYIWLDRERYDDAVAVLNQLLVKSREVNQQRKTVLFLSVLSIAERARGNKDVALATLRDAVLLASSQRYIRLLVDEPRLHAGIQEISQLRKNSESSLPDSGFIKSLVQKTASLTAEASPSVEPLTGKEMEIIQFLEGGLANKQIAAELFISEGTLKWHLHNIYSKLGVRNRTQALAEGRKQGYL